MNQVPYTLLSPRQTLNKAFLKVRPAKEKVELFRTNLRAPRIISKSQKFCRHKEAAKEAAEKKNAISTIEKIA